MRWRPRCTLDGDDHYIDLLLRDVTAGQVEGRTEQRVVALFRELLGWDYLGDWIDREGNSNVEAELRRKFLYEAQGGKTCASGSRVRADPRCLGPSTPRAALRVPSR